MVESHYFSALQQFDALEDEIDKLADAYGLPRNSPEAYRLRKQLDEARTKFKEWHKELVKA